MSDELTEFPDGVGFMENVYLGLTATQSHALAYKAGRRDDRPPHAKSSTWVGLVRYGLLTERTWEITDRGQALVDWLVETGRWPS